VRFCSDIGDRLDEKKPTMRPRRASPSLSKRSKFRWLTFHIKLPIALHGSWRTAHIGGLRYHENVCLRVRGLQFSVDVHKRSHKHTLHTFLTTTLDEQCEWIKLCWSERFYSDIGDRLDEKRFRSWISWLPPAHGVWIASINYHTLLLPSPQDRTCIN